MLNINSFRCERIEELFLILQNNEEILGILLGGSLSYKTNIEKSDVDLFCLINRIDTFEKNISNIFTKLNDIDGIIFQGSFPWTEKLYTIYFKEDLDFSIDLCLIGLDKSESFFWEPNGYIIYDKLKNIERCRAKQMSRPDYTKQPFLKSNPFSLAVVSLKKIEKNIARHHLWNAMEQMNILRRYIMQIIRISVIQDESFLGRVDRDIEDCIPNEMNITLANTTAIYNTVDIVQKTILLTNILISLQKCLENSNETEYRDWIFKQVKHEIIKLQQYL